MSLAVVDTILLTASTNWWIFVLQALLIVAVIWVLLHKTYFQNERNELTDQEVDAKIQESLDSWAPEQLVPQNHVQQRIQIHNQPKRRVLCSKAEKYIIVEDTKCLNLSTMNFLGLIGYREIEDRAVQAIEQYGVGSCGPRGFYGTVDAHLDLEEGLAKFMGTEEAIVYAYGFSCIASAIPAYAKRHDIIFADERVNFAIQKGIFASRSSVKYFRHNDPCSLESLLMAQAKLDKKDPEKAAKTRRFVIIEGIYLNTGELVKLPEIMVLKKKYCFRLFIDESISVGTVSGGHGVTSYYNIPIKDVDMIMGSLEYAFGSIGGFCCGSKFIIEHQRLSGLGYCFSASLPPLHAAAALKVINVMENSPHIFTELTNTCKLVSACFRELRGLKLGGWDASPVKHLYLYSSAIGDSFPDQILMKISDYCFRNGVSITRPSYLSEEESFEPIPSVRICVNRNFTWKEIEDAANVLQRALDEIEIGCKTQDNHEILHHKARIDLLREEEKFEMYHQQNLVDDSDLPGQTLETIQEEPYNLSSTISLDETDESYKFLQPESQPSKDCSVSGRKHSLESCVTRKEELDGVRRRAM